MSVGEVSISAPRRSKALPAMAFPLLFLSFAFLAAALYAPTPTGGFLVGAGMGLSALACLILLASSIGWLRRLATKAAFHLVARRSGTPGFLCDGEGRMLSCANLSEAERGPTGMEDWLARHLVSPRRRIAELTEQAFSARGRPVNAVLTPTLTARLRRFGHDAVVWSLTIAENGAVRDSMTEPGKPADTGNLPPAGPMTDLLDALPVPLLKIAGDGTIAAANVQARKLLTVDEVALPPVFELFEGMGRPISDWIEDAIKGRGLLKPEIVRALVPGQELFLQVALGRIEGDGEPMLIAVLNDATELKSLEAQFVQSQKMQAIGQLAGGVAHDFNNLLTAISGHCDLLLLRHDPGDPAYADLKQIEQNANRAASLVGQLLAFSRKQNLRPQPVDLRDTMSELTHLLNRLVGETIELVLTHEPGPKVIRADSRQLEQVIMNLVVNGRDAMPDGGRIEIRTRNICLGEPMMRDRVEVPVGDYVVITVTDQGHGIEPDVLPKVFEPFYTTKKTGEGTGLGLSTAYGIVKQTGGYIFVDSKAGEGTTFSLYFPAHAEKESVVAAAVPAARQKSAARKEGVVLLVEDEAPVRAFATRALRLRGLTVIEAESAEAALDALADDNLAVDVFVTDVIMPGMDGPTWVKKALESRPETKVVFVSGYAEESLTENQARVPNSVFLPKPFSLTQLTSVVQDQIA